MYCFGDTCRVAVFRLIKKPSLPNIRYYIYALHIRNCFIVLYSFLVIVLLSCILFWVVITRSILVNTCLTHVQ